MRAVIDTLSRRNRDLAICQGDRPTILADSFSGATGGASASN